MKLISTEELKEKLDRGDKFKLVMTFQAWAFEAKHIPGSINIYSEETAAGLIEPSDEIVVYCVNEMCQASVNAYRILEHHGFQNVYRYAGGLETWEAAGFLLEGKDTGKTIEADNNFMSGS
jgi:rhodanese-related sulfurtransferase